MEQTHSLQGEDEAGPGRGKCWRGRTEVWEEDKKWGVGEEVDEEEEPGRRKCWRGRECGRKARSGEVGVEEAWVKECRGGA